MSNSEAQRALILKGNIPRTVVKLAIPSIFIQIITLIYNTVDTYFISQIDKSAAAAVGSVFAIQAVIQAVGFGFAMGVSSICSRKLGEAKDEEANMIASSGTVAACIVAAVIGALGLLFLNPLLRVIGCTDTMLGFGRDYAAVILGFAPFACISFVVSNTLKAEGNMKKAMYGNVAGALINVALDPLLILGFRWGTTGAAVAICISQLVSLILFYLFFRNGKTVIHISVNYISRDIKTYVQIFLIGLPTVFRQGLASLATALLCTQAAVYGDAAVAAVTISNKCYMLIRGIVLGFGQGTQPVAGYNYGAGLYRRAKASFAFAMVVGTGICLASAALLAAFASDIMWWFCKDQEVMQYGVAALYYACMVIPVMAFSTFVNQEYQCLGFKTQATILASCRQGICFVPAILLLPVFLGVAGVEMAQPAADLLTFLISIPFYVVLSKRLSHDREHTEPATGD